MSNSDNNEYTDSNSSSDRKEKFSQGTREVWQKSKEKVKNLGQNVYQSLEDQSNAPLYGALAYIPVLGPLLVFVFKRNLGLAKKHAENASYLQVTFFIIWLVVWLLENLPLISTILKGIQFVPFITDAVMYLNVVGLLVLSVYGAVQSSNKKEWRVPVIFAVMHRLFNSKDNRALPVKND